MGTNIFLSHSWKDKPIALQLDQAVRGLAPSVSIWHDVKELQLGAGIDRGVEAAIDDAWFVALLWSVNAASSDGVAHELQHIARVGKRVVSIVYDAPQGSAPALPPSLGVNPLNLRLGADPSDERIELVAARLVEVSAEYLAADPEVALPGVESAQEEIRGWGSVLAELLGRERDPSVQAHKRRWPSVLRGSGSAAQRKAEELLDRLGPSVQVLDAVVEEVKRQPTDRERLLDLRVQAQALQDSDPEGAAQAIKVIDLRLADPL